MFKSVAFAFLLAAFALSVFADPELKGSPQELKGFLYPNDKIVMLSATAD